MVLRPVKRNNFNLEKSVGVFGKKMGKVVLGGKLPWGGGKGKKQAPQQLATEAKNFCKKESQD